MWLAAACGSALFAGLTSVLAKCGIRKTDSDIATAIRTTVVLIFSWLMAAVSGGISDIGKIDGYSLLFLILSGIATGASWICYFKALSMADVNKVVPIDKSSSVLTVILGILIFGEFGNLPVKLVCTALIGAGVLLMIDKKPAEQKQEKRVWIVYAVLSAVFAALTSVLAKVGVNGVESNLATAIRTCVVLVFAWTIAAAKGKLPLAVKTDRRELVFICLSGIATGASWLCYYYAIQNGAVSVVVPIDKMSILVSIVFSGIFFGERLSKKAVFGLCAMLAGTVGMAVFT
ncbi:MAG: EamA family transporter [Ruminiclostridium sp.]